MHRNFPIGYGGMATSDEPCSNLHRGTGPFSERETQAVRRAVGNNRDSRRFAAYLTVHCYGQYVFVPKTYEEGKTPTAERDVRVANRIREIIYQ